MDTIRHLKHKITSLPPEYILLAFLWALPLVYLPDAPLTSVAYRWGVLIGFALIILVSDGLRATTIREFRALTRSSKILLTLLTAMAIISTFASTQTWAIRLAGYSGEALGLLTWISFVVVAVAFRSQVRAFIASRLCLAISGLVCAGSLLSDTRLITHGFRVSGLLIIATSTAIYAALTLGLALWHLLFTKQNYLLAGTVALISTVTLVLCQSRAAQFSAVVVCIVYALYFARAKKLLALAPLAVVLLLVIIPVFGGSYFTRMRGEEVASGLAYRGDVYRLSAEEIIHQRLFLGLGPSGVPQQINSRLNAPPGIVETLNQRYVFLSAHDVFLDAALCFGLLGGLALLGLVGSAGYSLLRSQLTPETLLMSGVFFALVVNGLLNVPSIELTSLLIIVTVSLLPHLIVAKKKSKTKR